MANKRVAKKQANRIVEKKDKTIEKKSVTQEKTVKAEPVQDEQKPTFKASLYAMTVMIYAVISGAVTIMSMTMWIKPGYYFLESRLDKTMDFYSLDILYEASFSTALSKMVGILFVVIGVCSVISTILSIIMMVRTTNQEKKPMVLCSVLCLLLAALILVGFFVASGDMQKTFDASSIPQMATVEKCFGLYYGMLLVIILNAVVALVQMIVTLVSANKKKSSVA